MGSSEITWTNMLAYGPVQAFDVADAPGEWRDNADFLAVHTQNQRNNMDDRIDLQLVSGELLDGPGVDYVSGSFHAFGNNGTHMLGGAIDAGTGTDAAVLAALMLASEHLPIVATYQLKPAEVPEPNLLVLLVLGATGVLAYRRRRF